MRRSFTLSGAGLGIFLIGLGVAIFWDLTSGTAYWTMVLRFYPALLILLGLDYVLPGIGWGSKSRPESWVVTVIIIVTIGGLIGHLIPRPFFAEMQNRGRFGFHPDFSFSFHNITDEKTVRESFSLPQGIKTIRIENRFGDVKVNTGTGEAIAATARLRLSAALRKEIDAYRDGFTLSGRAEGDRFTIRLQEPQASAGLEVPKANTDITVETPPGMLVEVDNSFGGIEVVEVQGDLKISNGNGRVEIEKVTGDVTVKNQFSKVEVGTVGGNLTVEAANGMVSIGRVGKDLTVHHGFGQLKVGVVSGALNVTSSYGQVEVERVDGSAQIKNSFGGVSLDECNGPLKVEVRGGNLDVKAGKIGGDYNLEVELGNIMLELPSKAGFAIDASTSLGKIYSDFEFNLQREIASESGSGNVNGGGPLVKVRSSKGNINIKEM
jgi:DUF4097 and DUF4098 domain-containing protein YvlB